MKQLQVDANVPKQNLSASIIVEEPETIEEAVKVFGGESVLSNAVANWVITLQSNIRNGLKRGEDQATIQNRLSGAKMGVAAKGARIDPIQAYLLKFQSATPEAQKAMLAELQSRAAKK